MLVPKHNSRFRIFCHTICWSWWSINIYETFGRKKIAVPYGILFLCLAQKQVQIWGRRFSSILGFGSPNFAQRNALGDWNRINRHFGFWEKKYREMEFRPLGNESSPFCRTEWFDLHVKMIFSGRKVSLGSKLQILHIFDFLKTWNFNRSFYGTYLTATFHRFGVLAKAMLCSKCSKQSHHDSTTQWQHWSETDMGHSRNSMLVLSSI